MSTQANKQPGSLSTTGTTQPKEISYFFAFIYAAGIATVGLFLYSLYQRPIHVDSAILGEPTYWLSRDGVLRSELQRGWQHAEEHFFFTHKLFIYVGSLWTTLLGWSSPALNSLSLIYLIGLLGAWAMIAKSVRMSLRWYAVFFVLLLTNHHVYELSFVYRPEIAVAAFSSWCFYFLNQYLVLKKYRYLILAGVFAGFGIGHHLNGVVIVMAGFFLLLLERQFLPAVLFGALGSLGLGYYLIDIRSLQDFELMASQFRNMQDIQAVHSSWVHYALNIPYEQKRFFHSPVEIAFSGLIIPLFFFSWRSLWTNYRRFVIYALAGIICLALISHDKDTKYLSLHIPILTFLAVLCMRHISISYGPRMRYFRNYFLPFFIVCFFIGQWRSNLPLTFQKDRRTEAYAQIGKDLPDGTKILGPVYAIFWALPHHHRLQSFVAYQVLASHGDFVMDTPHLSAALNQYQIDAIIVDPDATTRFQLNDESFPEFRLAEENKDFGLRLFKRKSSLDGLPK